MSNSKNYTLGRGKILVDGHYLEETPVATFVSTPEGPAFDFETQTISPDNLAMFFEHMEPRDRTVVFQAHNPSGLNVNYRIVGKLQAVEFPLKGDNWQVLKFRIRFPVAGVTWEFPPIE